MNVTRIAKRCAIFSPLAFVVVGSLMYVGCSEGISGAGFRNAAPTVRFVNTPPAGSVFSRNEVISWVGSDVDGRIVEFRYVVVLEADIPSTMTVGDFAQSLPTDDNYQDKFIVRAVTLDDPANNDVVAMSADFDDPVRTVVSQYLFLYAVDDKGAFSSVAFRQFGRINHHPETRLEPFGLTFVNVTQQQFGSGGVPTVWDGSDDLDFPGDDEPPLEFEWRLYGPYNRAESTLIVDSMTTVVYVTTERTFQLGDTLYDTTFDFTRADTVIDMSDPNAPDTIITVAIAFTTTLPIILQNADSLKVLKRNSHFDTVLVLSSLLALDPPDSVRLVESSFNPLSGEAWVKDENRTFLDIYRKDIPVSGADTTRELTFLFWVRARDDAFVPDPTPSFGIFNAIEARHERDLLVVDFNTTGVFKNINGIWMPCSTDSAVTLGQASAKKRVVEYVSGWKAGLVGHTNAFAFDTGTFNCFEDDSNLVPPDRKCSEVDPRFSSPDYMFVQGFGLSGSSGFFGASLRDVLKHKVVIFLKEHVQNPIPMRAGSNGEKFLLSGVLDGINFWTMSRAPFLPRGFQHLEPVTYGTSDVQVPFIYSSIFGILGGAHQAWYGMAIFRDPARLEDSTIPAVERNEDFVGAATSEFFSSAEFPHLTVDPDRLRDGLRWVNTSICRDSRVHYPFLDTIAALPEVGFTIPATILGTRAIYLYESLYGEQSYPFWALPFKDYEGTVVAVRRNAGLFRTSHWQISPLVMDSATFQVAFNSMMDWLFQPWGGLTLGRAPAFPPLARTRPNRELRRLAAYLEQQRQADLREIMPAGERFVTNQLEFNRRLKEWQGWKAAEARAIAAGESAF
ncbi:MAG: hypothetical protein ACE5GA_07570 [Candidatus Zixiibacteriota bacterium]